MRPERKTVVKDINSGFFASALAMERRCFCPPENSCPLSCMGSQAIRQVIYKARLSCIQSCPQLRLRGVGISIPQVSSMVPERARLLGYIRYCVTKLFLGKFPDIGSIQTNPSGGNIVKAQNQLCNGGFSASRTADNGSCSAFLTLKGRWLKVFSSASGKRKVTSSKDRRVWEEAAPPNQVPQMYGDQVSRFQF